MKNSREARRSARKLFRECFVHGHLDVSRVQTAVRAVSEQKPRHFLGILHEILKLVRNEVQQHTLSIQSATLLQPNDVDQIRYSLETRHPGILMSRHEVNANLIGGLRVKIGSDVWDGSIAGKLQQIQAAL